MTVAMMMMMEMVIEVVLMFAKMRTAHTYHSKKGRMAKIKQIVPITSHSCIYFPK